MYVFSEGNAVHTVHLWQPSGNRPNKPKMPGEKKKKGGDKKRNQIINNSQKRVTRKKKSNQPPPSKTTPPPANVIPEQPALSFHNPGNSKYRVLSIIEYHNDIS